MVDHDVFISYSAKAKAIADAVCAALEGEAIACWIAPRNIAIGETWASAIGGAINDCRIMVLILSARSAASKDVAREVNSADTERKIILPFWTEEVELAKPLDYYLRNTYRVDARAPGLEQHLPALVNAVKHFLQTAPAPGPTPSSFPGQCAPAPIPPIPAPMPNPSWPVAPQSPTLVMPPRVAVQAAIAPPSPPSFGWTILKVSLLAALVGGILAPFGATACGAYLLIGPLIALIWLVIAAVRSNRSVSAILLATGSGLVAFFIAAFVGGLVTGAIMESIKPGSSFMKEQSPTTRQAQL